MNNCKINQYFVDWECGLISSKELVKGLAGHLKESDCPVDLYKIVYNSGERGRLSTQYLGSLTTQDYFQKNHLKYYKNSFKKGCQRLLSGKTSPYQLMYLLSVIEYRCNYPDWTGNLYNVLDWSEPETLADEHMIAEVNELLKT